MLDYFNDNTIYFMSKKTMSFFNILSKSQISFKCEKAFFKGCNQKPTVVNKEKRMFILGKIRMFEFQLIANQLQNRAAMYQ